MIYVTAGNSCYLIIPIYSDINECDRNTDNCSEDAQCTDSDGSFTCTCNIGYHGDGVICTSNASNEALHHIFFYLALYYMLKLYFPYRY